ncbi:hypothetical protein HYS31_05515 [Candidatus Woesearchaeota archaeon]|nr:hypothetical protein [Candidatus Woesearchaeota archaeon]
MKLNKLITGKGIIFLLVFSILVFVGDRINFSKLIGAENQFFTLFQFFGPVAGAFLGPVVGVLSVLIAEVSSYLVLGKAFTLVNVLRLLPMLFAAWYFGTKKDRLSFFVPIAAIALFVAHPVGRQVWYFSLFWTIPIILKAAPEKYAKHSVTAVIAVMGLLMFSLNPATRTILFVLGFVAVLALAYGASDVSSKSLGATFTAHAVGGAMWNYIVPMTPSAWIALIPVVIYERLLFASGITGSFVTLNTLLDKLDAKITAGYLNVDKKYILFRHWA